MCPHASVGGWREAAASTMGDGEGRARWAHNCDGGSRWPALCKTAAMCVLVARPAAGHLESGEAGDVRPVMSMGRGSRALAGRLAGPMARPLFRPSRVVGSTALRIRARADPSGCRVVFGLGVDEQGTTHAICIRGTRNKRVVSGWVDVVIQPLIVHPQLFRKHAEIS